MTKSSQQWNVENHQKFASFEDKKCGGGSEIRTHGTVARTAVFKTAALNHSAIPPQHPVPFTIL
jgi:hypothetical protein